MKKKEAIVAKQMVEEALKQYSDITRTSLKDVEITEKITKNFGIVKIKDYSLTIEPLGGTSRSIKLLTEVNSLEEAQQVVDTIKQFLVQHFTSKVKNIAFDIDDKHGPDFYAINKEYEQLLNQKEGDTSEVVVGSKISAQPFFNAMHSIIKNDILLLLDGDDHNNIKPNFFLLPEAREAMIQICKWNFDLGAINRVESYIEEITKEKIDMAENDDIYELIYYYEKIYKNASLSAKEAIDRLGRESRLLNEWQNDIKQASEILEGINEENKTEHFKTNVEPFVGACAKAIEITRARIETMLSMVKKAYDYMNSQELKDNLAEAILSRGNKCQKRFFQLCEQIAEKGGSVKSINSPSIVFRTRDDMTNTYYEPVEEARLYNGRVVSVFDQTVSGESFYPVKSSLEEQFRDDVYNKYELGWNPDGTKKEVYEYHKRQCAWYSGSDGSTYIWLKGVGFINTETEQLLTAEDFKKLENDKVKITLVSDWKSLIGERLSPRMKDGTPYMSVYDFERRVDNAKIYKIMKENNLLPPYFSEQAIRYLDSRFGVAIKQNSEATTEQFNEFDFNQKVEGANFESEKTEKLTENIDKEDIEEVKEQVKSRLAEKIMKAREGGATAKDLDIMPEMIAIAEIIAKEQGLDISVEAKEIRENVRALANYDKKVISFNLKALRNVDGFEIDVTKLERGDILNSAMNMIRLIQTMLHEIKHFEQKERIDNIGASVCDIETFKEAVENEIIKTGAGVHYYGKAHDSFLSELNADIYGWQNCLDCFKEYFGVEQVPAEIIRYCTEQVEKLAEKKQPSTSTIVGGNGCLSTFLDMYGDKEYKSTGKLVAEQFLEIVENLKRQMENGCDSGTTRVIEKMEDKCKDIIKRKIQSV